jgi:hypothetical protein
VVDRVDIEHNELPPLYAQTARSAFAKTRFQPGELKGLPVKSMMWVEVKYSPQVAPEIIQNNP